MLICAKRAVLNSTRWLSATEIKDLHGFNDKSPAEQPAEWLREGKIFSIHHDGAEYFPSYALDGMSGYRPLEIMSDVLKVFGATKDGWGIAFWFASVNGFLGGKRPQDLLTLQPGEVLAAAYDELQGIAHG